MAILIEGIGMPTGYSALTLKVWPDGQVEIIDADGEWKTSEAIPVPEPHGRLGDLDALPWRLANTSVKYATYKDWEMLCDAITAAPTVIPASEEGEA